MNFHPSKLNRRQFLAAMAAVAGRLGMAGLPGCGSSTGSDDPLADMPETPDIPEDVFQLGVASGDPLQDRVVIWTRLAPEPLSGGGMPDVDVPVIWEVFADEAMTRRVRQGWAWAVPEFGHSVHIDVDGLGPSTHYWYRFRIADTDASSIGRTRTFPRPEDTPEAFRLAVACCQKYRDGFYTPYPHMAEMELDAVLFLGDYIYESGGDTEVEGRLNLETEIVGDVQGFRERYGLYRSETTIQQAHAAHPWIVVWDDHEVSNNYGGFDFRESRAEQGEPRDVRAAGYQVWWEHMPVRLPDFDDPAFMRIYRRFDFGDLARLCMLDTRQYRDPQPCPGDIAPPCDEVLAGGLTILGAEQREWLKDSMRNSGRHWNVIAQQVLISPILNELGFANTDQWDGFITDRQEVLNLLGESAVSRPLVLTGDVHAAGFSDLYADAQDPTSGRVSYEILTTSIASGGDSGGSDAELASRLDRASDRTHYVDATTRGFTVCEITRERCVATYFAVDTVESEKSDIFIAAEFTIDANSFEFESSD